MGHEKNMNSQEHSQKGTRNVTVILPVAFAILAILASVAFVVAFIQLSMLKSQIAELKEKGTAGENNPFGTIIRNALL